MSQVLDGTGYSSTCRGGPGMVGTCWEAWSRTGFEVFSRGPGGRARCKTTCTLYVWRASDEGSSGDVVLLLLLCIHTHEPSPLACSENEPRRGMR